MFDHAKIIIDTGYTCWGQCTFIQIAAVVFDVFYNTNIDEWAHGIRHRCLMRKKFFDAIQWIAREVLKEMG